MPPSKTARPNALRRSGLLAGRALETCRQSAASKWPAAMSNAIKRVGGA